MKVSMKNIIIITITTLILTSCGSVFIPCESELPQNEIKTTLMPVETGNKWVFKQYVINRDSTVDEKGQKIIEIAGLDSMYFKDEDLNKLPLRVYRYKENGTIVQDFTYLKCPDGVILCRSYGYAPKEIAIGRTLPENPSAGWEDPRDGSAAWDGPVDIAVEAGTFECWYTTYEDPFIPKRLLREYYSKGVGLVKTEMMNWKYRVLYKTELISYNIND